MTSPNTILELPVHLVGIPDQMRNWLVQAGIPVVQLGQDSALKSAFRWKRKSGQAEVTSRVRCLLYDSRDVWSRAVVKTHQNHSCCKLDIAAWIESITSRERQALEKQGIENPVRYLFLERFKKALESVGGLWTRLADFPFPYQSVGFLGTRSAGKSSKIPLPTAAGQLDQIQRRYQAGLPSPILASDLPDLEGLPPATGLQSPGLPLLWRADETTFAKWWQHRSQLQMQLVQTPAEYRIDCQPLDEAFCPMLEIWRGQHLANVPLRSESILVHKDGLVFQHQPTRHPAGFTAGWPDRSSLRGSWPLSA